MNWRAIELHQAELELIADAAVPNKDQNRAIKNLIRSAINTLMNRVAEGWLTDNLAPQESQIPNSPSPKGTVLCGDDGRIVGVSDGTRVLAVEQPPAPLNEAA